MSKILRRFMLSAVLVGLTAAGAQAQTGWGALGLHTGWMNPAVHAEGPNERLSFDETMVFGASLDTWFGQSRRWGLGLEGTYSGWNEWDTDFGGDFGHRVHMFNYDASLQLRLRRPTFETRLLPFISAGIGGLTVNPSRNPASPFPTDPDICADPQDASRCEFLPADVELNQDMRTRPAAALAIGTDWFVDRNVAIRLQVKDYWTDRSHYRRASDGTFHEGGHNIVLTAGLVFGLGGVRVEEPGFVREEPIITPPAPEPPPPPAEESITVCVIDPATMRVQTVEAIRVPAENRVFVMRGGQRVAFETAHPTVAPIYVRDAAWFMADRPLIVHLEPATPTVAATDRTRLEFVRFGAPSQRAAQDLVFVGTIDGTPLYASRTDVTPFRTRLETHLAMHTDLETIFRMEPELIEDLAGVTTFYVGVEPNCVFQPVSVTHFVRRTRG